MVMVKLREVSKTSSSLGDGEDDPAKRKWKTYDEKRDYEGNVDKFSLELEDDKKKESSEFQAWKHWTYRSVPSSLPVGWGI